MGFGRPAVILLLTLFVAAAPAVSVEITPEPEALAGVLAPTPEDGTEEGSEEPAPPQRVEGPTFQRPGGENAERTAPVPLRRLDLVERLDQERDSIPVAFPPTPDLPRARVHVDLRAGLCALPPPAALLLPRR